MLTQLDNGQKFVVTYVNLSSNKNKGKYNSYEKECLAIVWSISSFQCYICGSQFTLVNNHHLGESTLWWLKIVVTNTIF
jgi:predicted nuclease of restriction endonuclease-like (RecB) superfamily